MEDDILRVLIILIIGVLFLSIAMCTNLALVDDNDQRIKSGAIVGAIGLIVGICLVYEYQDFTNLFGKGILTGNIFLLIMYGFDAFLSASKETQIIILGVIFITLMYESTWLRL